MPPFVSAPSCDSRLNVGMPDSFTRTLVLEMGGWDLALEPLENTMQEFACYQAPQRVCWNPTSPHLLEQVSIQQALELFLVLVLALVSAPASAPQQCLPQRRPHVVVYVLSS